VRLPKHVRSVRLQAPLVTHTFVTLQAVKGAREKLERLAAARPRLLSSLGHGKFVCDFAQVAEVLSTFKRTSKSRGQ
jgi:hypothetical protein